MREHMGYDRPRRQGSRPSIVLSPTPTWLIILNQLSLLVMPAVPSGSGLVMRSILALLCSASIVAASNAFAETRMFIIANPANSQGLDQCLVKGDKCGAQIARTYCQSREFAGASSYRRVDPDEITGSVPKSGANCSHGHCDEYVAITCRR